MQQLLKIVLYLGDQDSLYTISRDLGIREREHQREVKESS